MKTRYDIMNEISMSHLTQINTFYTLEILYMTMKNLV